MRKYTVFFFALLALCFHSCKEKNAVQSTIQISPNMAFMTVGEILQLTAKPSSGVQWSSSDTAVAKVAGGFVEAINDGHVVITASTKDASGTADIYITQEGGEYQGEYELVWAEEFDGTTLNSEYWNIEQGGGGWGNQEKQYYTDRAENIRVKNGCLEIEARKEQYGNNEYTSARINTKKKKDFAYGKFEARIKFPKGGGTWPAFWMLGYGSWPTCGEIDIVEHVGNNPYMASHAVHTRQKNGTKGNNWSSRQNMANMEEEWHVFGVEWLKTYLLGCDALRFYVDDQVGGVVYSSKNSTFEDWPFTQDRPEFIILNLALGGTMGGAINDNAFNNPVIMYVDWVHVYQKVMK